MFQLNTEHLLIRDMRPQDEDAFVAISQDKKYQRFYDESDCDPNKYRQLTRLFIAQAREVPRTSYQLAIEHRASGAFIGTVCLRLEGDQQASMGCGLSRHHQGQSLMIEAVHTLASFGFQELHVHRIFAETISENKAAIRLCQRLGMRKEAHFHQHRFFKDRWWDTVVYAVLHTEWAQRHGAQSPEATTKDEDPPSCH